MPANIDPTTGISYGVIDARHVPELYAEICQRGPNLTLQAAEDRAEHRLTSELEDLDTSEAFTEIETQAALNDDGDTDDADCYDEKDKWLRAFFVRALTRALDTDTVVPDAVEAAMEFVDVESGTFDMAEVIDAVVTVLYENEYFQSDGEDTYNYTDGEFTYELSYLGGAPLIWVTKSPFVTYCRTCSPCVPNAGDLDNGMSQDEGNCIAYCMSPDDISDMPRKPVAIYKTDAEGNMGDIAWPKN
jgi:hypothetical protein